jgi:hypothetical protein
MQNDTEGAARVGQLTMTELTSKSNCFLKGDYDVANNADRSRPLVVNRHLIEVELGLYIDASAS